MVLKINPNTNETEWAKTYEACTRYHLTAMTAVPDGGLLFSQSAVVGDPKTRLVKTDQLGQLSPDCPFWELPTPALVPLFVAVIPLVFASSGTFRLSAQHGLCTIVDSFRIQLGNCGPTRVFVPNAFSPNGDGANDDWEVYGQPGVRPLSCQIFDRWGNQCYRSKPDEIPRWDGTINSRQLPPGVYVWLFRLLNPEGNEEVLSGDLLLVR